MGRARWAVMVVDKRQRSEHKAVGVVHWWESGGESARLEEEWGGVVRTMGWTKVRRIIFAMMRCATIAKAADDRPCSIAGRICLTPPALWWCIQIFWIPLRAERTDVHLHVLASALRVVGSDAETRQ